MDDVHHRYPTLSRRQVALFERNPVCELCFRVCLDLSEEYGGGIHFELLQSLEAADSFCERIILNPWDLLDIDQYYHWLERQLDNSKPAVTCAFATISVTLSCMDGLPEPVLQLSHDIRGLIGGGQGGELYDNLRSAARYNDILIHADTYGDIPPQPDLQRELEQFKDAYNQAASEVITLKKQLQMKEQQDDQKAVYKFYGPYIKENHVEAGGNQILSAENVYLPGAEKVSIDAASSLSAAPHDSAENPSSSVNPESDSGNIPLFKYIHYSITSESERLDIHRQICNIVRLPKMQLVCDALLVLMKSQKILTTIDQSAMLTELRRLGLPSATTPGFSDQNFFSYYRTK